MLITPHLSLTFGKRVRSERKPIQLHFITTTDASKPVIFQKGNEVPFNDVKNNANLLARYGTLIKEIANEQRPAITLNPNPSSLDFVEKGMVDFLTRLGQSPLFTLGIGKNATVAIGTEAKTDLSRVSLGVNGLTILPAQLNALIAPRNRPGLMRIFHESFPDIDTNKIRQAFPFPLLSFFGSDSNGAERPLLILGPDRSLETFKSPKK